MANIIIREKKIPGQTPHRERYPESGRIAEKIQKRRNEGKPIDGSFFKEMGQALRETSQNKRRI